jgi:hypothetical protein
MPVVKVIAGYHLQDRVPQKFQPFVAALFLDAVLIGVGAVGHGIEKQIPVLKLVPDALLQLIQSTIHVKPPFIEGKNP